VTLAIVGDGELRNELERCAQTHPSHDVRFLGYQEKAAQYLLAFDIFVLPSLKEGLPYVLLEAGLAGLSVVATNVGGIPEIIEDTKTGVLVPPESVSALTGALNDLIENEPQRHAYGAALQEKVLRDFSLENMITNTIACY
jgi:glycosyltransferase involved in cell wall biosynthesis